MPESVWPTLFLLNAEQKAIAAQQRNALNFRFSTSEWRYVHQSSPESASAYDEGYIFSLLKKNGLKLRPPIHYGNWSGRQDGLSFQDILIIERS